MKLIYIINVVWVTYEKKDDLSFYTKGTNCPISQMRSQSNHGSGKGCGNKYIVWIGQKR